MVSNELSTKSVNLISSMRKLRGGFILFLLTGSTVRSTSRKRRRPSSHSRLKAAVVILIAAALVVSYAVAAGWLTLFPSNVLGNPNGSTDGSATGPPTGYPVWPQDSTSIVRGFCSDKTVQFWVQKQTVGPALANVTQQILDACGIGQTAGGIVRSQQGWYLEQITAESTQTATTTRKH
jgi:hypothetical protein